MVLLIGVRLHGKGKSFHFDPLDLPLKKGDFVIVETVQGMEFGVCSGDIQEVEEEQISYELKPILRLATDEDIKHFEDNQLLEAEAFSICVSKIKELNLDMNLVDVEYMFDNKRVIFYFTAEGRVDFRQLVKDLAAVFHTRIELRQIGVRDEARLLGGIGSCGRELCCRTFLRNFVPVSIKMVKEQNLSMNPAKISGQCGRLLCCLNYEQEAYVDARKRVPNVGTLVDTPLGSGVIDSQNLLKEQVRVKIKNNDNFEFHNFTVTEIKVLEKSCCCAKKKNQSQSSVSERMAELKQQLHSDEREDAQAD